jgi:DNA-binding CsgD family transcriptional regulator
MMPNPESRFKLESVVGAMNSLLAELGPDPGRNLEAIVGRACELLKCECVVYGCLEEGSGAVLIRYAHNLPQSAAAACELAREIVGRIICTAGREPICSFSLPETGPGAEAPAGPLFKSVLGCPLRLGGGSAAALVALDSRPRRFGEEKRLLIAVLGMVLAMEEFRLQREQGFGARPDGANPSAPQDRPPSLAAPKNLQAGPRAGRTAQETLEAALSAIIHEPVDAADQGTALAVESLHRLIDPAWMSPPAGAAEAPGDPCDEIVRSVLEKIALHLDSRRENIYRSLTPMESKVAGLIRQGRVNKEIAQQLNLTVRSVELHRYNIRNKLGLRKVKTNLQRYLELNG